MADTKLERCKKYLRSTLLSNKGGIPAAEVYKHYKDLVGDGIPYAQFNFPTLEAFLSSMPDVCQICWSGRDLMVVGVADRATQHIEKMVSRQQNAKKGGVRPKRGSMPPPPPRFGNGGGSYGGCEARQGGNVRPPPVVSAPRFRPSSSPVVAKKMITNSLIRKSPPNSPRVKIDLKTPVQSEKVFYETAGGQAVYGTRVEDLLVGRQHGLYTSQVEKMYQKKWEQSLPRDWCDMMERGRRVRVVREAGASPMVYPAVGNNNTVTSNSSISRVKMPNTPEWDITICSVTSTNQIHLWLGEADHHLTRLHNTMLTHHFKNTGILSPSLTTSPPMVGELYSALVAGDQCVRRVKVLQVDRSNFSAKCFMLDYGEEIVVSWRRLVELEIGFRELPVQAVKASLAGVEQKSGKLEVQFVKKYLQGRRLVGVLVGEVDKVIPSLVLFDTSQEEDIMISEEIIKYISSPNNNPPHYQPLSPPPPITQARHPGLSTLTSPPLPAVGEYYDLVVSHVVSPNLFYVQSHATLPAYTSLITQMTNYYANHGSSMINTDYTSGSFFAMVVSDTWYRARLVRHMSSSLFCMCMVDTGKLVMASKETIKPLVKQFFQLPVQAIKSKLSSVEVMNEKEAWGEMAVEWFRHVALKKSLVGLVESKSGDELIFTMYDTSVQDVDTVLNSEMVAMGLARKK